jgi:hypothetical protein
VIQGGRSLGFPSKARQRRCVFRYRPTKRLESNEARKPRILGFVHHSYSALAEKSHNSIASRYHLIGFEGSVALGQRSKGHDTAKWTLEESTRIIMFSNQAHDFSAKILVTSAGFRQKLWSLFGRLLDRRVKDF